MENIYPKNFLDKVIIRIDFANPFEELRNGIAVNFKNKIYPSFPILEPQQIFEQKFSLDLSPESSRLKDTKGGEYIDWVFYGKDRDKELHLNINSLFITYSKYSTFDMLRDDFLTVLRPLSELSSSFGIKRLGLRYINNIALKEKNVTNWNKYLNRSLICNLKVVPDSDYSLRAFSVVELQSKGVKVRFQYGMINSDFPAPIHKKEFILDYDAYYEGLLRTIPEIESRLDQCRKKIKELFEFSIKDDLRGIMSE